ncbi:hypothetical protein, partial [Phreatobacter sp.]|uniref:hypothetical protein n=1 Tax=Phreatobacter sp. TaxID=1966341 RepID=UPI0025DB8044
MPRPIRVGDGAVEHRPQQVVCADLGVEAADDGLNHRHAERFRQQPAVDQHDTRGGGTTLHGGVSF